MKQSGNRSSTGEAVGRSFNRSPHCGRRVKVWIGNCVMSGVTDRRETRLNLSAIRANRGLSLHEIAEQTKIGTRYLEAIEAERFEWLPGLVYSTSYIRQYAKAIDYDPEAILTLYDEMIGAPDTRDQRDE